MEAATNQQVPHRLSRAVRLCRWLWRGLRFFWGSVVLGFLLNLLASLLLLARGTDPHSLYIWPVMNWLQHHLVLAFALASLLLLLTVAIGIGSHRASSIATLPTSATADQQSRIHVLEALDKAYMHELQSSLQGVARISLGLHERFDLTHTARLVFWHPDKLEQPLPVDTTIVEVYDQAGRGLLIIGEPGAGKTTLLYDLAQTLLERAKQAEAHAVPIVLNLSSWVQQQQPLQEWVVRELELRYIIPRQLGQRWLREDRLLLLLDGLDEVTSSARYACIQAINVYHMDHLAPLVVCSRQEEYITQPHRLILQSAVIVQPLTPEQIATYLKLGGSQLAAVRRALKTNPVLKGIVTTPLLLNVMILTYREKTVKELPQAGSAEELQQQIFAHYVQRMLLMPGKLHTTSPANMQRRLTWLAGQMRERSESLLYLERLQPTWLSTRWARQLYLWVGVHLPDILIGCLVSFTVALLFTVRYTIEDTIIVVALGGLIGGLLSMKQRLISRIRSTSERGYWRTIILTPLLCGLGSALSAMGTDTVAGSSFPLALLDAAIWGIGLALAALLLLLEKPSLSGEKRPTRAGTPTWRHLLVSDVLQNGFLIGGLFGLCNGLSFGLGASQPGGLSAGLRNGLTSALWFGLIAVLVSLLVNRPTSVTPTEILVWSWKKLRRGFLIWGHYRDTFFIGIGVLLFAGGGTGLPTGFSYGLIAGLTSWLSSGLGFGLSIAASYRLVVGLLQGVTGDSFSEQQRLAPNQGTQRSLRNGLLLGVLSGGIGAIVGGLSIILSFGLSQELIAGLRSGLTLGLYNGQSFMLSDGLSDGLLIGLASGLLAFFLSGGLAWWRHWTLRFLLWREDSTPWRTVHLLDEAAQHVLLHKSGGGYRFVHDLLRDYLASLGAAEPAHSSLPPSR